MDLSYWSFLILNYTMYIGSGMCFLSTTVLLFLNDFSNQNQQISLKAQMQQFKTMTSISIFIYATSFFTNYYWILFYIVSCMEIYFVCQQYDLAISSNNVHTLKNTIIFGYNAEEYMKTKMGRLIFLIAIMTTGYFLPIILIQKACQKILQ